MKLPTIHTNGTSAEMLRDAYLNAVQAIRLAVKAVESVEFNGRDYYVQEPGAFNSARQEHVNRITQLEQVAADLMLIVEHVQDAIDAKERQRAQSAPDASTEQTAALRCVVAALSQPCQTTDITGADEKRLRGLVEILRADARMAVETAQQTLARIS